MDSKRDNLSDRNLHTPTDVVVLLLVTTTSDPNLPQTLLSPGTVDGTLPLHHPYGVETQTWWAKKRLPT